MRLMEIVPSVKSNETFCAGGRDQYLCDANNDYKLKPTLKCTLDFRNLN